MEDGEIAGGEFGKGFDAIFCMSDESIKCIEGGECKGNRRLKAGDSRSRGRSGDFVFGMLGERHMDSTSLSSSAGVSRRSWLGVCIDNESKWFVRSFADADAGCDLDLAGVDSVICDLDGGAG